MLQLPETGRTLGDMLDQICHHVAFAIASRRKDPFLWEGRSGLLGKEFVWPFWVDILNTLVDE